MTITEMICTGIALVWLVCLASFLNWGRKRELRTYQEAIEDWQQFAMENGGNDTARNLREAGAGGKTAPTRYSVEYVTTWPESPECLKPPSQAAPLPQDCAVNRDSHSNPREPGGVGG